ncbi:MAG: 8-oxo-dGTP diphosphatase, partial [Chloroflexota bacterium]
MKLATLCYLKRDGETLMLHRTKKENDMHAGKWNGLGGKLEPGESPEECAIREVGEEAGYLVKNPTLRGMITFPGFANDEDWYVFLFVIDEFEGEMIDSAEGYLRWIPDDQVLDLPLWEG